MFDYWSCWGFGVVAWEERPGRTSWGKKVALTKLFLDMFQIVTTYFQIFSTSPSSRSHQQLADIRYHQKIVVFFSVPSGIQWWDCATSRWSAVILWGQGLHLETYEELIVDGWPHRRRLPEHGNATRTSPRRRVGILRILRIQVTSHFLQTDGKNDGKKYEKIPWHDETWWNMWVLLSIWVLLCVF